MTDEKAIRSTMLELMEVAKRAFNAHLQTGTGGNISARVVGKQCRGDQTERRGIQRVQPR